MRIVISALLVLLVVLSANPSWAAITCDTVSSSVAEADPQDLSYTVGTTTTSNRIVIVQTSWRHEGGSITGVTFDGNAMTQIGSSAINTTPNPDVGTALWQITGVSSGTFTISANWSGALTTSTVTAYTCYGVNQTTPVRVGSPNNSGAAASATSVSIAISSAVGDLVIDGIGVAGVDSASEPDVGADQTELYACVANSGTNFDSCGSTEPGAASVTMSWSASTSEPWAIVGASLVPAAAVPNFGFLRRRQW